MKRVLSLPLVAVMGLGLMQAPAVPPMQAQAKQESKVPKVGDMAPDFKLLDQNFKTVSLSDYRGKKNVALAFYVFAFTGG